jgi:hypothetical protein
MNDFTLTCFLLCWGMFLVIMVTWFTAFFYPTNSVTIFINRQGEMLLELIVLPIVFGLCTIGLFKEFKLNYLGVKA